MVEIQQEFLEQDNALSHNVESEPLLLLRVSSKLGSTTRRPLPSRTSNVWMSLAGGGHFPRQVTAPVALRTWAASASRSIFFQANECPLFSLVHGKKGRYALLLRSFSATDSIPMSIAESGRKPKRT
jgi:hypothetical protein